MVMARVLTAKDLATYRQTVLVFMFVAPLLQLGVTQGIYYFLPKETERIRGRVVDALVVLAIMGLLFGVVIGVGGNHYLAGEFSNPQVAELLLWMIPFAIITLPATLIAPVLVMRERVLLSSIFSVIRQLLIGACTLIPLLVWTNPEAPLIGHVLAGVITGILAIVVMIQATPRGAARPAFAEIKELVWFSFPLGVASMVGAISMKLGNLIVSVSASPEIFAVFSMGARELPFIAIVTGAITSVLLPEMTRSFERNEARKALNLWKLAAIKASLVLFPVTAFLMVFAEDLVVLLFSSKYIASTGVFMVFLAMLPLRVFSFGSILVSAGASRFILWRTVIWAVVCFGLSLAFMQVFGIIGVALGILISQYLLAFPLNLWKIKNVTDSSYWKVVPIKELGLIMALACLPLLVAIPASLLLGAPWSLFLGAAIYGVLLAILYGVTGQVSLKGLHERIRRRLTSAL